MGATALTSTRPDSERLAVLQVIPWYAPRSWGGTEQFVHSLCKVLPARGIRSEVAVVDGGIEAPTEHSGVRVWRIDNSNVDAAAAGVLDAARRMGAGLVNMHAWTPLTGAHMLAAIRAAGLRCVINLHVPSLICARGTMLRDGITPCDGMVQTGRCTACWLGTKGMPAPIAKILAALPENFTAWSAGWMPGPRVRTALLASAAMRQRGIDVAELFRTVDHMVVPAQWFADALLLNGANPDRVAVCRPGVDQDWLASLGSVDGAQREAGLEVVFVGRWDVAKGLDLVLVAMERIAAQVDVRLTMCCTRPADGEAHAERERLLQRWGGARWLRLVEGANRKELAGYYRGSDVVVIPSRCMETGPIVALEAQAAGCAVFGSDLGGIRELLEGRAGDRLLPIDSPTAWAQALTEAAQAPRRERRVAALVRSGHVVADEMAAVYRGVMDRVLQ